MLNKTFDNNKKEKFFWENKEDKFFMKIKKKIVT